MNARRAGKRPLYQQIADDLRDAIDRGDLAPGQQLPTEQQLMDQHNVSRNTVRLGLAALTNEGLISSSQGSGSFVRERASLRYFASQIDSQARRAQLTKDAFLSDVDEQHRSGRVQLDVAMVSLTPDFAARLELDDDSTAVARRCVHYCDDQPYALSDCYFPHGLVRDSEIEQPANIERGSNKVLDELGHIQTRFRDEITIRMPTADEARRLDIDPAGTPVAYLLRTAYDQNGVPVRLEAVVLPGDRYILIYDVDGS